MDSRPDTLSSTLSKAQAAYYIGTGLWPILHMRSFEFVCGPKADDWLAKMMGGLSAVIGLSLALGSHKKPGNETVALGVGAATVFTLVDLVYTTEERVPPIYMLDALAEMVFILGWIAYKQQSFDEEKTELTQA